ncbi:MAG: hypothetical protein QG657_1821 [Acidobacteriota bacterium]|nr:hypothetical protein [Acidobacteriota bacterium]
MCFFVKKNFSPAFTYECYFLDDSFDKLYRAEERVQTIFKFFSLLALAANLIALLTVGYQSVKTALANPVQALKYE